jgi:hypothetical protein
MRPMFGEKPVAAAKRCLLAVAVVAASLVASLPARAAQTSIKVIVNGDIITSYDIAQRTRILP